MSKAQGSDAVECKSYSRFCDRLELNFSALSPSFSSLDRAPLSGANIQANVNRCLSTLSKCMPESDVGYIIAYYSDLYKLWTILSVKEVAK